MFRGPCHYEKSQEEKIEVSTDELRKNKINPVKFSLIGQKNILRNKAVIHCLC